MSGAHKIPDLKFEDQNLASFAGLVIHPPLMLGLQIKIYGDHIVSIFDAQEMMDSSNRYLGFGHTGWAIRAILLRWKVYSTGGGPSIASVSPARGT